MTAEAPPLSPAPPQRRRSPLREPLLRAVTVVAPLLVSAALQILAWTLRLRFVNGERLFERWEREQVILTFWHNRLIVMPIAGRGKKLCVMNSQSRDGEIATRALARWGIHSVRGSATRGGTAGFLQLVRAFRQGYHLAVVPDGPRGPRYQVKAGVIHLARATGAPLIPVSYSASRFKQLRSWDRLIIPLPFANVTYVVGEPIEVPRHANDEEIEVLRRQLEVQLNALTAQADRAAAKTPE
ncbi:MAG: lysophospholipid acyltransferase family protein [Deltaproteobacteria bacterium]|nr:lysophospholipid acyltransferase family protein [Deltaproteobacteria bacterium]